MTEETQTQEPFFFEDAQRREILNALIDTYATNSGLAVITGVRGCGMSTLVGEFVARLQRENPSLAELNVAIIDVAQTTVAGLLCDLLAAFGYELPEASHTELLSITRLISQHQAEAGAPPLLIFENAHRASPKVLALINALAGTKYRRGSAFRVVLTGEDQLRRIVKAEGMSDVGARLSYSAGLRPLTISEQRQFIAQTLERSGNTAHDNAFDHLVHLSAGLPSTLASVIEMACESVTDGMPISSGDVLLAVESQRRRDATIAETGEDLSGTMIRKTPVPDQQVPEAPQSVDAPATKNALGEIFVSHNGKLIQRYIVNRRKVLVGRAPHNDIVLDSKWVSRHHAIVVCTPEGASLVDINSTNGMTINSREARQGRLADKDVVVIGKFRLKYRNANARRDADGDANGLTETRVLRAIAPIEAEDLTAQLPEDKKHSSD
ncbi:MAG: FHA domain-containing protein [Pseudomonadota bacterium]